MNKKGAIKLISILIFTIVMYYLMTRASNYEQGERIPDEFFEFDNEGFCKYEFRAMMDHFDSFHCENELYMCLFERDFKLKSGEVYVSNCYNLEGDCEKSYLNNKYNCFFYKYE